MQKVTSQIAHIDDCVSSLLFDLYCSFSGEDRGFLNRAFLLYDGIHYDPLLIAGADGAIVQSLFPTSDNRVLLEAVQIAKDAFKVSLCIPIINCV